MNERVSQCSIADQHGQVKTLKPLAVPVVTPLVTPIPSDPEGCVCVYVYTVCVRKCGKCVCAVECPLLSRGKEKG